MNGCEDGWVGVRMDGRIGEWMDDGIEWMDDGRTKGRREGKERKEGRKGKKRRNVFQKSYGQLLIDLALNPSLPIPKQGISNKFFVMLPLLIFIEPLLHWACTS